MEEQSKTVEERRAEMKKQDKEDQKEIVDKTKPYMTNLNEDP